jgi:hypothetical protein
MTDYNLPKNTNRHDSVPVPNPTEQKPCQPPTCDGNNDAPNDAQSGPQ